MNGRHVANNLCFAFNPGLRSCSIRVHPSLATLFIWSFSPVELGVRNFTPPFPAGVVQRGVSPKTKPPGVAGGHTTFNAHSRTCFRQASISGSGFLEFSSYSIGYTVFVFQRLQGLCNSGVTFKSPSPAILNCFWPSGSVFTSLRCTPKTRLPNR